MISFESVSKSFGDIKVLDDISFAIERGTRVSLIGPGGCGKTTIFKLLLGLMTPEEGDVYLIETNMAKSSDSQREKVLSRVGMAFQQGGLFDFMTVKENLVFAMEHMTDQSADEINKKVDVVLAGVKLPKTQNMFPYELSGGMKRRVGIARALATDPIVAIFDEPTSGLDPVTSTIILNMILDMVKTVTDLTQVVATSNVEIAIRFADRIIVMNDMGKIVADGPWRELLLTGPDWVKHFLSVRLIGLDLEYAHELDLPKEFIKKHWS